MYKSNKLVEGIGIKGIQYPTWQGDKAVKEYKLWKNMLYRCTKEYWAGLPTYTDTACSDNFKYYTFFYEWCRAQRGFNGKDKKGKSWHLDKDLLVKGNKLYSEDTCVFLPENINLLLRKFKSARGEYPIGVYWNKGNSKFMARCNRGDGTEQYLGYFLLAHEAFLAYKTYKEALIKQIANEYRSQLDPRAYEALLNYTVEITD